MVSGYQSFLSDDRMDGKLSVFINSDKLNSFWTVAFVH